MSDNPLPPFNESLPSEAMQAEDQGRGWYPPSNIDPTVERASQTARLIAITLLIMLGATFALNIVTLIVLTWKNRLDAIPSFERMFAIWMPLLSGLVGSAVGFYLTKEKK